MHTPTAPTISVTDDTAAQGDRAQMRHAHERGPDAVLDRLNCEFAALNDTPSARSWVRNVVSETGTFPGCDRPADIVSWIQSTATYDQIDVALIALLRRAQAGEDIAGRIIIQAVRGSLINTAVRAHASIGRGRRPFPEFLHHAIAAAWTVVATYPIQRRPAAVIKNLTLDTLNLALKFASDDVTSREIPHSPESMTSLVPDADENASAQRADDEVVEMLCFAVREGHLTQQEATLLARLGFAEDRAQEARLIAEEYGLSYAAIRQRHSRLTRRLTAALAA